jgi:uncharacterized membrane protein
MIKTLAPAKQRLNGQQLPDRQKPRIVGIGMSKSEIYSGPLPHPDHFQKYEQICPGAANRIIKMAEGQIVHRQKLETKHLDSNVKNERLGMHYSFWIIAMFIAAGITLIIEKQEVGGYFSLFGPALIQVVNLGFHKHKEQQPPKNTVGEPKNKKGKNLKKK